MSEHSPATTAERNRPRGPDTILRALLRPRFLLSAWPWRALAFSAGSTVVLGVLLSVAGPLYTPWALSFGLLLVDPEAFLSGAGIALVLTGLALGALLGPLLGPVLGTVERWRLGLLHGHVAPSGHRPVTEPGPAAWLRVRYTEAATWREVAYAAISPLTHGLTVFVLISLVLSAFLLGLSPLLLTSPAETVTLGPLTLTGPREALPYSLAAPVLLGLALYANAFLAGIQGLVARALITGPPPEQLRAELTEVTDSRARLVGAFEYERRRIERDLHDGAQQKLVAVRMDLGMARLDLEEGSGADRRVAAAHTRIGELIDELRELVRGIHPRVLVDRGLPAALGELADHNPASVSVETDLPRRLPAHVEATAYFVAAEALTNAHKHTEARSVTVRARMDGEGTQERLVLEVADDGPGGADPGRGSGLTGMSDRAAVMGGTMELSSPQGGPTRVRVELPCRTDPAPTTT
ncbi:sensor histidine kinase [Nocardiopsis kunsanensis]|uniref:sensor histidine kinase n=1 Tax=Nocardiopsis kunsanensis TaxID=141693 RepID=UPI00034CE74B|nr:sensor histidine kinase [Nocardiopsis kunsanensis]